jgi:rubrerythrin
MKTWRCAVCGYEVEAEAKPEECPVCGTGEIAFSESEE